MVYDRVVMCLTTGICDESNVDAYYVLKQESYLLGYIRSKMVWSESSARWEIYDLVNNNLSMQSIDIKHYSKSILRCIYTTKQFNK